MRIVSSKFFQFVLMLVGLSVAGTAAAGSVSCAQAACDRPIGIAIPESLKAVNTELQAQADKSACRSTMDGSLTLALEQSGDLKELFFGISTAEVEAGLNEISGYEQAKTHPEVVATVEKIRQHVQSHVFHHSEVKIEAQLKYLKLREDTTALMIYLGYTASEGASSVGTSQRIFYAYGPEISLDVIGIEECLIMPQDIAGLASQYRRDYFDNVAVEPGYLKLRAELVAVIERLAR